MKYLVVILVTIGFWSIVFSGLNTIYSALSAREVELLQELRDMIHTRKNLEADVANETMLLENLGE